MPFDYCGQALQEWPVKGFFFGGMKMEKNIDLLKYEVDPARKYDLKNKPLTS